MKLIKLIIFFLIANFFAFCSFATTPNWQNEKLDIKIYSKKNTDNNFNILVEFNLKNGWLISWDNPGDAGIPTTFKWNKNIKRVAFSQPQKKVYEDIIAQYGYSDKAYYLFEGQANEDIISVNISWEACKDECEKENATIEFSLLQNSKDSFDKAFKNAKDTFPLALSNYVDYTTEYKNDAYFLNIVIKDFLFNENIEDLYFIPYQKSTILNAQKQNFTRQNNNLSIMVQLEKPILLSHGGLLVINNKAYTLNFATTQNNISNFSSFYILLLAFIGGMVLNLMPCVFPVLSLKALTIKQNQNKKQNIKNAVFYLSGVILSFLTMAFLLYIFRKTGQAIGWGFQLQSPYFVVVMLIIFIILLLMVLEIIVIKSGLVNLFNKLGSLNSFMSGFFAVLIASPCTGPFLGAALGFTLLQSPSIYFMIFFSLGLGYGLPFALIEIYPEKIAKMLPKSGKWMNTLKYILAIPIFLTCLWLVWILYHQIGVTQNEKLTKHWKNYDEVEIRSLINQNQAVFIDFTAKWCLTCLLNEKTVLHTDSFIQFAKENQINLFMADLTEHNEDVGQAIKAFGRNSVPLYVYYPKREQNYTILPQLLEINYLKSVLNGKNQDQN